MSVKTQDATPPKVATFNRQALHHSFAHNLRAIRTRAGLSRQDVANRLRDLIGHRTRQEVIYQLETLRAKPSIDRIAELALVLNVEPADLLRISVPADTLDGYEDTGT